MPSKRRQEGELMIDHRNSPGLPRGFGFIPGKPPPPNAPGGTLVEGPTYTCSHCGVVVWLNPQRTRPHEYCWRCDHYVCPQPACALDCRPLKAMFDAVYKTIARAEAVQFAPSHTPTPLYAPSGAVLTSTGPTPEVAAPPPIFGPDGGLLLGKAL